MVSDGSMRQVVLGRERFASMEGLEGVRLLEVCGAEVLARPRGRVWGKSTAGSLAYCIYTSGSTGTPKGCVESVPRVQLRFFGVGDIRGAVVRGQAGSGFQGVPPGSGSVRGAIGSRESDGGEPDADGVQPGVSRVGPDGGRFGDGAGVDLRWRGVASGDAIGVASSPPWG